VIFYPTGGGTGLIGMWKAFQEMQQLGWIDDALPRMVAVQSEGCAPIVRAWQQGADHADPWENAETIAAGIRVPAAIGDFLMLRAIRESGGFGIAVPDTEIERAQQRLAGNEGLLISPEGAATVAGYERALDQGLVDRGERVVLFNCGNGLKYPMPDAGKTLDHRETIDWGALERRRSG
jgi:threonine synthase